MKLTKPKRNILSCAAGIGVLAIVIIACRREAVQEVNTAFDSASAKEWYYGVFKKSIEWASHRQNTTNGVQLPDWKQGITRKLGGMEIVEFPLIKSKSRVALASGENNQRLAEAVLSRIVFIRKDGQMYVREMDYIPDAGYAGRKGYDISDNNIQKLDPAFTGRLVIKKWGGQELSRRLVENGKITKKGRRVPVAASQTVQKESDASSRESCTTYRICEWYQDCWYELQGDNLVKECSAWTPTGYCWEETYCEADPCDGLNNEECGCVLYGICGGGEEGEGENCDNKQAELASAGTVMSEKESITETSNNGTLRSKKYVWKVYSVSNGMLPMYLVSTEKGVHELDSYGVFWYWKSLTHDKISKRGTEVLYSTSWSSEEAAINFDDIRRVANMNLDFDITISIVCKGMPVSYNGHAAPSTSWHVDE